MRLDKRIGANPDDTSEPFINASYFADEMDYLHRQGKKIQVRINSVGGNVLAGWTIYDAITICEADTHCYGLASSMAGICLLAGKKRTADSHATAMLHGPHTKEPGTNPYMEEVKAAFAELLKTRTKMTDDMIAKIVEKGDHYFDASDMYDLGMITHAPIESKIQSPKKINASVKQLQEIYASLEKPNDNEMEQESKSPKWLKALFGGNNEEETISATMKIKGEVAKLESEKIQLTAENTALKGRVAALEAQIASAGKDDIGKQAKELIEAAVKEKKLVLTTEQQTSLIATASLSKESLESVKLMVGQSGTTKPTSVAAAITIGEKGADKMGYEEMGIKHPEALAKIAEENPTLFAEMQDEFLAKNKK